MVTKGLSLRKRLCPTLDGNKTFKGYIYTHLVVSLGPKGHPNFMEGGGPTSCLVHHKSSCAAAALPHTEPNWDGFGFGAGCVYIYLNSFFSSNAVILRRD